MVNREDIRKRLDVLKNNKGSVLYRFCCIGLNLTCYQFREFIVLEKYENKEISEKEAGEQLKLVKKIFIDTINEDYDVEEFVEEFEVYLKGKDNDKHKWSS